MVIERRIRILFYCLFLLAALAAMLASCSNGEKVYKIGVSQCSKGRWRDKVNNEMLAAQHLYEQNVKVSIASSDDDTQQQINQIDSLVDSGIDLLVVAPNEAAPIAKAIARVKEKGIPVICFDRKIETDDYTAFIGGNNVEAGKAVAVNAIDVAHSLMAGGHKPFVLEVTAAMSSTPARERHQGFEQTMKGHDELEYEWREGDWSSEETYRIVADQIKTGHLPDIVFCHNDGMATGAYKAVVETGTEGKVRIMGIDGMPGEGLDYVQFGHQIATYVYPTGGEEIIRLALDILTGKPYERENTLQGILVVPENVWPVTTTTNELLKQNENLVTIQNKLEDYFGLYNVQGKIILACLFAMLLLAVALLLIWRAVRQTRKANRRIQAMHDEQTAFYTNARHQLRTPLTLVAGPVKQIQEAHVLKGEWQEIMDIVSRNVAQLETVVSDVLNFKMGEAQTVVDDETAESVMPQKSSEENLKETRLALMKQDDTEELSNVLIVDDNADMRRYLRTLLADKFYVLEAPDGQSGLKLARECVPDIVVSDVMMPVMDGLQFCKKLKEDGITSHIPVILLTARSTDSQQMEGYEHGADAYLTKPFNAQLLVARIYNLLKNRQQLGHPAEAKTEEPKSPLSTQDKLFFDTLKEVFLRNMSNPELKMDDLGDELGMSRVQLYRKVKALTGISPVELLREMRLQRAHTLINTTTKSISEIAYEVGFHTPSYFSNCFKKQFGQYPTELRENN
ncbi:MAG: substrate-binding domain-containing protein [Prevotella sp.]|nr:substrate-binding domain-containing protein [Prevotella sp.]